MDDLSFDPASEPVHFLSAVDEVMAAMHARVDAIAAEQDLVVQEPCS